MCGYNIHGCMLGVHSVGSRVCTLSVQCMRCSFEDLIMRCVPLLHEATILSNICTEPVGNKSLGYGCLRLRYRAVTRLPIAHLMLEYKGTSKRGT